jgi:hypothetical protein
VRINHFKNKIVNILVKSFFIFGVFLTLANIAYAIDTYAPLENITIGEFIYNDDYTPTADDCKISIYSPSLVVQVNEATMTDEGSSAVTGWHYYAWTTLAAEGKYPAFITCGSSGTGDLFKLDKSFLVKAPVVTDSSIAAAVDLNTSSTVSGAVTTINSNTDTKTGNLATTLSGLPATIWGYTSRTMTAFGALAADVWNNTYAPTRALTTYGTLVADIWNNGTRTLTSGGGGATAADIWSYGTRNLTDNTLTSGSLAKVSDLSGLATATNVTSATSPLATTAQLTSAVSPLATSAGVTSATSPLATAASISALNNISVAQIWDYLTSGITTTSSIGKLLKDNIDATISSRGTSTLAVGDLSGLATSAQLTSATSPLATTAQLTSAVSPLATSAGVTSATSPLATAASISALNNISVAQIWDYLTSGITTTSSIGKLLKDNIDATISSRGTSTLAVGDLSGLATSAQLTSATSPLATSAGLTSATSGLATAASISALNNISAADVWASGTRTLTSGAAPTASDIWSYGTRNLTDNTLTSGSLAKVSDLSGLATATNVTSATSPLATTAQLTSAVSPLATSAGVTSATSPLATAASISALNNISVAQIWDYLTSGITTTSSIGKLLKDNIDATISSRGTSTLAVGDLSGLATSAQLTSATSPLATSAGLTSATSGLATAASISALNNISAADVWASGTRTLTSGAAPTASDIWSYGTRNLTDNTLTSGSLAKVSDLSGLATATNVTSATSPLATTAQLTSAVSPLATSAGVTSATSPLATAASISALNNISVAQIWDYLTSGITTTSSIGKLLKDNIDATISSRGTSTLAVGDLSGLATSAQLTSATSPLATSAGLTSATSGLATAASISALNNISAADVWASGTRTLTSGAAPTASDIWSYGTRNLTDNTLTSGSLAKVSDLSGLATATNVTSATSPLATTAQLTSAVSPLATSAGVTSATSPLATAASISALNNISVAQIWDYLTSGITTTSSIGKLLKDNIDATISSRGTSTLAVGDLSGLATSAQLTSATSPLATSAGLTSATSGLATAASISALNNISAADVWASGTRTLTSGAAPTASDIWSYGTRNLTDNTLTSGSLAKVSDLSGLATATNVTSATSPLATTAQLTSAVSPLATSAGVTSATSPLATAASISALNNISVAQIWDYLTSGITTTSSIGKLLKDNIDATISSRGTSTLAVGDLSGLATSAQLTSATSPLATSAGLTSATSGLATAASISALNNISAADVWASGTRTLTSGAAPTASDIWSYGTRNLTDNTLTSGSLAKVSDLSGLATATNVTSATSPLATTAQLTSAVSPLATSAGVTSATSPLATAASISALNNISVAQIWDYLTSGITTTSSIGKLLKDNIDATISSRGTSTLAVGDLSGLATSAQLTSATSPLATSAGLTSATSGLATAASISALNNISAADVWASGTRTLTSGAAPTASDIWSYGTRNLTDNTLTSGSLAKVSDLSGLATATNVTSATSPLATTAQLTSAVSPLATSAGVTSATSPLATAASISALNNISVAQIWDYLTSGITTTSSIGKLLKDNIDATISSRGTSTLAVGDLSGLATSAQLTSATSPLATSAGLTSATSGLATAASISALNNISAADVWASGTRTLTSGAAPTASDIWSYGTRNLTDNTLTSGSLAKVSDLSGLATATNVTSATSPLATTAQLTSAVSPLATSAGVTSATSPLATAASISALNNISVAQIWDYLTSGITTTSSIGKLLKDNIDATISSRGTSTLAVGDLSGLATSAQLTSATSPLATSAGLTSATSGLATAASISALNNISAADVWASGTRTLTSGAAPTASDIWSYGTRNLTDNTLTSGSLAKVSDLSGLATATNVTSATSPLATTAQLTSAVSPLATSAGVTSATSPLATAASISALNNISVAQIWDYLTSGITTTSSIGKLLKDNIDATISSRGTSTLAVGDLSGLATSAQLTSATSPLATSAGLTSATSGLATAASISALNNISAADVWASGTRTLTSGAAPTASDIWSYGTRNLTDNTLTSGSLAKVSDLSGLATATNVTSATSPLATTAQLTSAVSPLATSAGVTSATSPLATAASISALNNISVAQIWDYLTSGITTTSSIGKLLKDNIDATISSRGTSTLAVGDLSGLATSAQLTSATSPLATSAGLTSATSGLATAASISALNNISAADVWASGTRTLTSGAAPTASDIWSYGTRNLTDNTLTSGSLAKVSDLSGLATATNVTSATSPLATTAQLTSAVSPLATSAGVTSATSPLATAASISALNNISVAQIWDYLTSGITTTSSIGKLLKDNIDATISSRGTSTLAVGDLSGLATSAQLTSATSPLATSAGLTSATSGLATAASISALNNISAADVWASGTRTLTSGAAPTASDIWSYGTRNLTDNTLTSGSLAKVSDLSGLATATNVTSATSPLATTAQLTSAVSPLATSAGVTSATSPLATAASISALNNISVAQIWDYLTSGITTTSSIGKLLKDNIDATISSRGTSTLAVGDLSGLATSAQLTSATSPLATSAGLTSATSGLATAASISALNNISAADVWASGTRTLTSGAAPTASDIWSYGTRNLTDNTLTSGSLAKVSDLSGLATATNVTSATSPLATTAQLTSAVSPLATSAGLSSTADSINLNTNNGLSSTVSTISGLITNIPTNVWAYTTRTLSSFGTLASDVWNSATRTLTSMTLSSSSPWSVTVSDFGSINAGNNYLATVTTIYNGSVTDAVSAPTVTIYDPSRNVIANNVSMTRTGTGTYVYSYTTPSNAAAGTWESIFSANVESGKTLPGNDYWTVVTNPLQVIINSITDNTIPGIAANITLTNEGLSGSEYQYTWCIVSTENNPCGGNDDIFHATAAKYINSGQDFNTILTATVPNIGNYYFKVVGYFGTENSVASRSFTAVAQPVTPPSGGGGGGGGGGGSSDNKPTIDQAKCGKRGDFNCEGKVNSIDFSILLYYWKAKSPFKNQYVDINKDGKVDSVDFSILLYQWGK